ncbi:MAG: EAL domain-containing protein, partial [Nocardioidaceae bacterium]
GLWQHELVLPASFHLHVNISPVHFRGAALVAFVTEALRRWEVPPTSVVLEITESELMQDEPEIIQTLHDLRAEGVGLAIDDFGTGYCSISCQRLPVDMVKIDRALVTGVDTDPQQRRLAAAVVQLIEAVQLTPIVDGVETAAEAAQLQALGCRFAQGPHFSAPLPAKEMTDRLRGRRALRSSAAQPDTISG